MESPDTQPTSAGTRRAWHPLDGVLLGLCAVGWLLCAWLWVRHYLGAHAPGCAGGSCADLQASRWGSLMLVPVGALGMAVYVAVAALVLARRWGGWVLAAAGFLLGAAVWWVTLQVMLGRYCGWCLAAHAVGVAVAVLVLFRLGWTGPERRFPERLVLPWGGWAVLAVLVLGLAQRHGPAPATHRLEVAPRAAAAAAQMDGHGRKVPFAGGGKVFDLTAVPHLGDGTEPVVVAEYFDYTCGGCVVMTRYMEALRRKHPGRICVILLPVPFQRACNPMLAAEIPEHPGSCLLARLGLALWHADPQRFQQLHGWIMTEGRTLDEIRSKLAAELPKVDWKQAVADPRITALLAANGQDFRDFSAQDAALPKVLLGPAKILHRLPIDEAEFIRVMERELGL